MSPNQRLLALIYDLSAPVHTAEDGEWFQLTPDRSTVGIQVKIRRTENLDGHGPRYTYELVDTNTWNL